MSVPNALFNSTTPLNYPSGVVPNLTPLRKNKDLSYNKKIKRRVKSRPPRLGFIYLIEIQTPDDRVYYKVGISINESLQRYNLIHIKASLIVRVPTTMHAASEMKLRLLRQYKQYHGLYPARFGFKGYQDCLTLPDYLVEQVIFELESIRK